MNTKILFVDDEANVLGGYRRALRGRYEVCTAEGPEAGLRAIRAQGPFAVVVSDMRMPGMDGIRFLREVLGLAPDTVRVMLTGHADLQTAIDALNQGSIFRFITKPCPPETLTAILDAAIQQHSLVVAEKELLEKTLRGSVQVLTEILASADPQVYGRAAQVRQRIVEVARHLGIQDTWLLEVAAMLAPVGSATIPPVVRLRARMGKALSGAERDMLARVPAVGRTLLGHIPRLEPAAAIVAYQAKNFDGTGFPPDPVAGTAIPVGARLLRILTDLGNFEAEGHTLGAAATELRSRKGCYDPELLEKVVECLLPPAGAIPEAEWVAVEMPLEKLQVGQVTATDIVSSEGAILVPAGHAITPTMLERLRNFALSVGIQQPLCIRSKAEALAR